MSVVFKRTLYIRNISVDSVGLCDAADEGDSSRLGCEPVRQESLVVFLCRRAASAVSDDPNLHGSTDHRRHC